MDWARRIVSIGVASPPTTSTTGNKYTGLYGWPTTRRSGWVIVACSVVGLIPEVEEPISVVGFAAASISANTAALISGRSGTLSCTNATLVTASATDVAIRHSPRLDVSSPRSSHANTALASTSRMMASASGDGSEIATSTPESTNLLAHPAPITPHPTTAADDGACGRNAGSAAESGSAMFGK